MSRLVKRGDALFVECTMRNYLTPTATTVLWRVSFVTRSGYRPRHPEHGDELADEGIAASTANYSGDGYRVHFPSTLQAEEATEHAIPCPKVRRGIETRYERGGWQKLLRTGWQPA